MSLLLCRLCDFLKVLLQTIKKLHLGSFFIEKQDNYHNENSNLIKLARQLLLKYEAYASILPSSGLRHLNK